MVEGTFHRGGEFGHLWVGEEKMRRSIIAVLVAVVALCVACDDGNLIKDPALRACVQREFDWYRDQGINKDYDVNNKEDLKIIELMFYCDNKGVKSLEGIEYLLNVNELRLENNEIEDLSPLAGHPKVYSVVVTNNKIRELKRVNEIGNLYELEISSNYISDISMLVDNKKLERLFLYNNCFSDASQCDALKQSLSELTIYGCEAENQHPERCQ